MPSSRSPTASASSASPPTTSTTPRRPSAGSPPRSPRCEHDAASTRSTPGCPVRREPTCGRAPSSSGGSPATRGWSSWPARSVAPRRSTCRSWPRTCRRSRARTGWTRCSTSASSSKRAAAGCTATANGVRHLARYRWWRRESVDTLRGRAWATIDRELDVIEQLGFPGYFLVVWDLVEFCRRNDIFCQGRGSAANSAACYALGITKADAVSLGLLFERFLSTERDGPPDIDIDIESDRREEVIQYVYERYGRHHTAQVANVITYRARSSIRDMAKALGHTTGQQDAYAKQIDGWGGVEATAAQPDCTIPEPVLDLARQIEDAPRHLGIHSGGMVICDRPVIEVCPVEWGRMDQRSVLQWDKDDCANAGLVKFDLLGLGMLSALHYAVDLIAEHRGYRRGPGDHPAGGRRLRHAVPCRHRRCVPDRVAGADGHAAASQAAPVLRPGGRGRADPPRPDPGRVGAPVHPAPQRAGAGHLPASAARERARQDARRAAVPGAADADGDRRRRVHAVGVRRAASGDGVEAVGGPHGEPEGAVCSPAWPNVASPARSPTRSSTR